MRKVIIFIIGLVLSVMIMGFRGDPYTDSYLFIECELTTTIELANAGNIGSSSDLAYTYDVNKRSIEVDADVNELNLEGIGEIDESNKAILGLTMILKMNGVVIEGNMITTPEILDILIAEGGLESCYTIKPLFLEYNQEGGVKISLNDKELTLKPNENIAESKEYENHTISMAGETFTVDYFKENVVVKNIGFINKNSVIFK